MSHEAIWPYHEFIRIKRDIQRIPLFHDKFLKLNDDKTELLISKTREELSKISDISTKVVDQSISQSDDPPSSLGVIFEITHGLDAHIAKLCRTINFNLYSVGKIRKYIDGPTALSYGLSYGAKQSHIHRLQCCQNNAGLYLKGASLTTLSLCLENCIGFPWSIGSVTKFCSPPTRH